MTLSRCLHTPPIVTVAGEDAMPSLGWDNETGLENRPRRDSLDAGHYRTVFSCPPPDRRHRHGGHPDVHTDTDVVQPVRRDSRRI